MAGGNFDERNDFFRNLEDKSTTSPSQYFHFTNSKKSIIQSTGKNDSVHDFDETIVSSVRNLEEIDSSPPRDCCIFFSSNSHNRGETRITRQERGNHERKNDSARDFDQTIVSNFRNLEGIDSSHLAIAIIFFFL